MNPRRLSGLLSCSVLLSAGAVGQIEWREHSLSTQRQIEMTFDGARGRLVALRGDKILEWDGSAWQTRPTATRPASRLNHGFVFDDVRRRVLLFGGIAGNVQFGDTWEYDGADWTQRVTPTAPAARSSAVMAWDPVRSRAVLFGGLIYGGALHSDTWEWDGNAWTRALVSGPIGRNDAAMAWHPGSQRMVLFGGADGMVPRSDTWTWDGTSWTQMQPATVPVRRAGHRMTTDFARGCVVMCGGPDPYPWEWWGGDWQRGPQGPSQRTGFGLAWDGTTGQVAMYGGTTTAMTTSSVTTMGDTWTYDGTQWLQLGNGGPQPRAGAGIDYDPVRDRLVFVGGGDAWTTPTHTWEWDGAVWREIIPPVEPPYFQLTRVCHDRARGRTVLFGGMLSLFGQNAVWEWDGSNWTNPQPPVSPPGRFDHAMAFDRVRAHVLVFGGRNLNVGYGDTWAWNGSIWTPLATAGPSARSGHAMAYDVARDRMLLFGGLTSGQGGTMVADTWEWNGSVWQQRLPAHAPSARLYHAMVHDAARGRIVLAGGARSSAAQADSWEWDGSDWSRAGDVGGALAPLVAWHDRLGRVVALNLVSAGTMLVSNDLWIGSPSVAGIATSGTACGGARLPQLSPFGDPVLGRTVFRLDVVRLAAQAPFVLAVAMDATTMPIGGNCRMLQNGLVSVLAVANVDGFAVVPAPVPANPVLIGLEAVFQVGALDPTAPLGFGLTAVVTARVGD
ncbi:MAG: hypothetical protein IPK26_08435 [Planctomycetes bacterium]|nr:hypothetical protein [Planctomycetota bacterium]